jgi:hypothetical protein
LVGKRWADRVVCSALVELAVEGGLALRTDLEGIVQG